MAKINPKDPTRSIGPKQDDPVKPGTNALKQLKQDNKAIGPKQDDPAPPPPPDSRKR